MTPVDLLVGAVFGGAVLALAWVVYTVTSTEIECAMRRISREEIEKDRKWQKCLDDLNKPPKKRAET